MIEALRCGSRHLLDQGPCRERDPDGRFGVSSLIRQERWREVQRTNRSILERSHRAHDTTDATAITLAARQQGVDETLVFGIAKA